MKISIVTVCYNSQDTIADTIKSVQSQDYPNIEYIVVDGNSTDNTNDIVKSFGHTVSLHISENDNGLYDAMNKGIRHATGDVVGILNSDDIYESESVISDVVSKFRDDLDLVFGDLVFVKQDNLTKITRFYSLPNFKAWKLRFGWMPPHPATFIRRECYEKFGLYKDGYKISADYELFVRFLLVNKLSFKHFSKTLIRMRDGGVSTSGIKSSITLNSEIIRGCRTNGVYTNMLFLLLKIPFKLMELFKRPRDA